MHLLDEVVRDSVTPQLAKRGFTRHGRTFEMTSAEGDVGLITFQSLESSTDSVMFYVNLAVAPRPYLDWLFFGGHVRRPRHLDAAYGLWHVQLRVPEHRKPRDRFGLLRTEWRCTRGSDQREGGEAIAEELERTGLPRLLHFLDRTELESELRAGTVHYLELPVNVRPLVRALIAVVIDTAEPDEVGRLMAQAGPPSNEYDHFHEWAAHRIAVRRDATEQGGH